MALITHYIIPTHAAIPATRHDPRTAAAVGTAPEPELVVLGDPELVLEALPVALLWIPVEVAMVVTRVSAALVSVLVSALVPETVPSVSVSVSTTEEDPGDDVSAGGVVVSGASGDSVSVSAAVVVFAGGAPPSVLGSMNLGE